LEKKWPYKLTSQLFDAPTDNKGNKRDSNVPPFSLPVFLEYLVRFIVADDQVSPDNLAFFHTQKSSVYLCCRVPRVSTAVYGSSWESRRLWDPSPR
jgi:hypothetical protein